MRGRQAYHWRLTDEVTDREERVVNVRPTMFSRGTMGKRASWDVRWQFFPVQTGPEFLMFLRASEAAIPVSAYRRGASHDIFHDNGIVLVTRSGDRCRL
jgi:hypothetical protein